MYQLTYTRHIILDAVVHITCIIYSYHSSIYEYISRMKSVTDAEVVMDSMAMDAVLDAVEQEDPFFVAYVALRK